MIELEEVVFSYPATARPAVRGVTATFELGAVTLVTGPLGAGCSTLLLVAAGLAPQVTGGWVTGRVATLGIDPTTTRGRRALAGRVGLLLPTPWTQLSGMASTVADEVAFGPANLGWSRERITQAVEHALGLTGIGHLARRDPTTLSGGELQRVIFAGVVAMQPEVYLLDEPTLELDAAGADGLQRLLPELARRAAIVIATTDLDRMVEIAARVLLLHKGRAVAFGAPDDVLGTDRAVMAHTSTTVAAIARDGGFAAPYPLTVADVLRRVAP